MTAPTSMGRAIAAALPLRTSWFMECSARSATASSCSLSAIRQHACSNTTCHEDASHAASSSGSSSILQWAMGSVRTFTTSAAAHERKEMRFPAPRHVREAGQRKKALPPTSTVEDSLAQPSLAPLERIDPLNVDQQKQLSFQGRQLTGDPGSSRWGAPFYIPPELQKGVPRALLVDPWASPDDQQRRRDHARLLVAYLRAQAPKRMTAAQIMQQINAEQETTFGSLDYVRQLLEHLRVARMIRAANNPDERTLGPGVKDYPLMYYGIPHQQEEYGAPGLISASRQAKQQATLERALKRLRQGKPAYRIHRRRAHESSFHDELGQQQVRLALQQQEQETQEQEVLQAQSSSRWF